jgi:hypothetical protein
MAAMGACSHAGTAHAALSRVRPRADHSQDCPPGAGHVQRVQRPHSAGRIARTQRLGHDHRRRPERGGYA